MNYETALQLLIFDGDDTLWDTQALYTEAKQQLLEYLGDCNCDPDKIRNFFETEDLANVTTLGFTLGRFEHSIRTTIDAFCPAGSRSTRNVEEFIGSIRRLIKGGATPLVHGAEPLLKELRSTYRMILLTKGDPSLQEHRIASSGLRRYFERVYIVDHKTPETFREVLLGASVAPKDAWSIGNSLRSDIEPAISIGMRAIWIERHTWAGEEAVDHAHHSVVAVSTLDDVRSILIRGARN